VQHASSNAQLPSWLEQQPVFLGAAWLESLEQRKQEEARFHDADREGFRNEREREVGNAHWYKATAPVSEHLRAWIVREAPHNIVLDYACGSGGMTREIARAGAAFAVGIDISEVSVRNATHTAHAEGLSDRVRFLQRDCEATELPDTAFDRILCTGMLHHLDLDRAMPELSRILKPGGRILCVEALNYNPAIKLYRRLTPRHRTDWEARHILSLREVRYARRWFAVENMRFFCMTSPLATLLRPGRARNLALQVGHAIDTLVTRIPLVQLWSWQFAFELVKGTK
jgi:SAM-dependent methyltransferase